MSKPKILFICTHNSARSQIAEGLLRNIYGEKYEVFSAGTNPTKVNPLAIKVMAEIGIDISKQYSKGLEEFSDTEIDLAISVCQSSAKTLCALCSSPITMGRPLIVNAMLHKTKNYIVHGFEDPSEVEGTEEEKLAAFRRTRDQIKAWITGYFVDLITTSQTNEHKDMPESH
jgi:arsenate reductase